MKKLMVSLLVICLLCCSGCVESENIESRAERGAIHYVDFTNNIVADKDTHILYYLYDFDGVVLSPYYSRNGKFCRYEDGKIIEVNTDGDSD